MPAVTRRDLLKLSGGSLALGLSGTTGVAAQDRTESGSWPQYQFDGANTGASTDRRGPREGVALSWQQSVTNAGDGITTAPVVTGGTVYVGSWDNHLYAIDTADGSVRWQRDLSWSVRSRGVAATDDIVIGATGEGIVYGLAPDDGATEWSVDVGTPVVAAPVIADGLVYIGNLNGTLVALGVTDGEERWRYESTGIAPIWATPAVRDGRVYVSLSILNEVPDDESLKPRDVGDKETIEEMDAEGKVIALESTTGEPLWETPTSGVITAASVAGSDNVYIGTWDRFLHAFSVADGSTTWEQPLADVAVASPTLADERLFVGSHDGEIAALQTIDGSTDWTTVMDGNIVSPPTSDGGRLFVSTDRRVHALDLNGGDERWRVDTGTWDVWSPAVTANSLYLTDGTGRVLRIRSGESAQLSLSGSRNGRSNVFSEDRGLFVNGGGGPEILTNVFNLTVAGFVLSVGGLVYQLMEGR